MQFFELNHSQTIVPSVYSYGAVLCYLCVCVCCDYRDAERERKTRQIVQDLQNMQHEAKMEQLSHHRQKR